MVNNYIIISNGFGGIATFQSNLINFLIEKKNSVYLIDKKKNETLSNLKNKNKNKLKKFISTTLIEFTKTIHYIKQIGRINSKNIFIISNPAILLIYFIFIKIFCKNNKIIFVYHSHIFKENFKNILIGYISSFLTLFVDQVIFVSKFTQTWWKKFIFFTNFKKSKVVHNYTDKIIIYKKNKKINTVGFVGRADPEKGLSNFLNYALNTKIKNIKFKIFSDLKKIEKKYLKNNIKFYNWKNKKFIYTKIDILFVTSKIENCPFTVLESKSVGIPTITISEGGINEIISNNKDGILLKKNVNFHKIDKNIKNIIKNYNKFKSNCFKKSINHNTYKINSLYKLLNKN